MPGSPSPVALPLRRGHLADGVFSVLGAEILGGVLAVGAPLPAERLLSERFGVSKLLVRQAIHRLAQAGLVEVRQGGATRILDPGESPDLRTLELYYRLAPESERTKDLAREVLEKQFTQGLSLVEVFARRASRAARDALLALVESAREARHDDAKTTRFEERFWRAIADGGDNRILRAEVRWWYTALAARPEMPGKASPAARWAFYAELALRLQNGDGAVAFYLAALTPGIRALFALPRRAPRQGDAGRRIRTRTETNTRKRKASR